MSKKPLRVGLLGLAGEADFWLRAYRQQPGVEVVALADADAGRRTVFAGEGLTLVESPEAMLAVGIDVVEVNLPTAEQFAAARVLLAEGKHLGLRFPAAENLDQMRQLQNAAGHARVRTGAPHWYFPPLLRGLEIMDKEWIGNLQNLRIKAVLGGQGGWREARETEPLAPDLGCFGRQWQALGLLRLFGKVEAVHVLGRQDNAIVAARYPGLDRLGAYEAGFAPSMTVRADGAPAAETVEASGTDGYLYLNRLSGHLREAPAVATMIHDTYAQYAGDLPTGWLSAYEGAAGDLLAAARGGRQPRCSWEEGIEDLKLLLAVDESLRQRREITLD